MLGAAEQELRGQMPLYLPRRVSSVTTKHFSLQQAVNSYRISCGFHSLQMLFPWEVKHGQLHGEHSSVLNCPLPSGKRPKQGTCTQCIIPGSSAALAAQSHPPQAPEGSP